MAVLVWTGVVVASAVTWLETRLWQGNEHAVAYLLACSAVALFGGALLSFPAWLFVGTAIMLTQWATLTVIVETPDPSTDALMGITVGVLAPVFTALAGLGHLFRAILARAHRMRSRDRE